MYFYNNSCNIKFDCIQKKKKEKQKKTAFFPLYIKIFQQPLQLQALKHQLFQGTIFIHEQLCKYIDRNMIIQFIINGMLYWFHWDSALMPSQVYLEQKTAQLHPEPRSLGYLQTLYKLYEIVWFLQLFQVQESLISFFSVLKQDRMWSRISQ